MIARNARLASVSRNQLNNVCMHYDQLLANLTNPSNQCKIHAVNEVASDRRSLGWSDTRKAQACARAETLCLPRAERAPDQFTQIRLVCDWQPSAFADCTTTLAELTACLDDISSATNQLWLTLQSTSCDDYDALEGHVGVMAMTDGFIEVPPRCATLHEQCAATRQHLSLARWKPRKISDGPKTE